MSRKPTTGRTVHPLILNHRAVAQDGTAFGPVSNDCIPKPSIIHCCETANEDCSRVTHDETGPYETMRQHVMVTS